MTDSDSLELLIKDMKKKYLHRNFVSIDPEHMIKLNLQEGDIIEIVGKKKSAGIVKAPKRKEKDSDVIHIHSKFRKNIGKDVDETVEIKKANVKTAHTVVLLPYGQKLLSIDHNINKGETIETIRQTLEDSYPITLHDKVYISTRVGIGSITDEYIVASLIPDDICLVNEYTNVIFMDDSTEGYYNKSYNIFKKILELDPQDKNIWLSIGNICRLQNKNDEAEEAYNKVITLDPKNYWAWMTLGLIYNQKESYDQALHAFQNALDFFEGGSYEKTGPMMPAKYRSLIRNLGFALKRTGNLDKGIEIYRNVLDKFPKSKNIWNELGKIYYKKAEYKKALKMFKMSLGINFNEAYVLDSFLSALSTLKSEEPSVKLSFRKRAHQKQFTQDNQVSLYYLAKTFKAIGNLKRALEACKGCLELNHRFEKALKLQSELLRN